MARGRPYDPVTMAIAGVMPPRREAGGEAALARFARRHALRAPEGTARLTIRAVFALLRALLTAFLIEVLTKLLPLRIGARLLASFTLLGALRAVAADFLAPLGTLRRRQRAQAALLAVALGTLLPLLLAPVGTVLPLLTAFLTGILTKLLSLRIGARLLAFFTPLGALRAVAADFLAPLGTLRRRQRAQAALLAAALDTLLLLLLTPFGTVLLLFLPLFLTRRRALLALLLCRIALLHGIRFRLRLPLLPGALLLALLA
jgi:hypothetical protein